MNAFLVFEITVSIVPFYYEGSALYAGFGIVLQVYQVDLISFFVAPSGVHAKEHGSPVHGVHSACTGVDGYDGSAFVVFAV